MGVVVPSTHFSTNDLPAADRFDAWRDKIAVIFDVDRIGGMDSAAFEARVDAYQIGNLVITDSAQSEQTYSLSPTRTRAAPTDLFQVALYRSGGYRGDANGCAIGGAGGGVQVLDLAKPMRSIEATSDMVCVFLPRELLQERVGDLDNLHGCELRADMRQLLADYLNLLAKRLPDMPEADGKTLADAAVEMIAACLRPTATRIQKAQSPIHDVMLLRAQRLIERNLASSKLTPDFLCRTLGVSRRSLYRLFEPLDGVHQYILRRRLAHIMRELNDRANHERLADIGALYGFSCQETFWRAFKRQYSVTPGEVRSLKGIRETNEPSRNQAGFDEWLRRLGIQQ